MFRNTHPTRETPLCQQRSWELELEQSGLDGEFFEVALRSCAQVLDDLAGTQRAELRRFDRIGAQGEAVEEARGEHVAGTVLVDDVVDFAGRYRDDAGHG